LTNPRLDQEEQQRRWVEQLLSQAQARRFYGRITLILEDGTVRRATKEESLKPPE
jgi:hypothetical protein